MVEGLFFSKERDSSLDSAVHLGTTRATTGPTGQGTNHRHWARLPMCSQAVYLSMSKEEREAEEKEPGAPRWWSMRGEMNERLLCLSPWAPGSSSFRWGLWGQFREPLVGPAVVSWGQDPHRGTY